MTQPIAAPPWQVERWFNTQTPLQLADLRGKVVVVEAFQMLCPGCVEFALPQAKRLAEYFSADQVAVIGLHTVFEHHAAMTAVSLEAFLHEYAIRFPVGIDQSLTDSNIPATMRDYHMQGTPTTTLIDKQGYLRMQHLGPVADLVLGARIGALIVE